MAVERQIPIPAELIFSEGKTPQPEDEKLEQAKSGMKERLGKLEDTLKGRGNASIARQPEGSGQTPDLSKIPRYGGFRIDGDPLDYLQKHYGMGLSVYDAEQDTIFQPDLRRHDSRLLAAVDYAVGKAGWGLKLGDFVKPSWNTGRKQTPEEIAKRASKRIGRKHSPETRVKMSEAHKGIHLSPETRAKLSEARKGKKRKPFTPEHRARISAAKQGKPL
jgi:hypothetical protein